MSDLLTISEQRAAVVAEARTWVKTPYHTNAGIKGVGCDCGMLLVRVFVDIGLVEPFDPRPYPKDWHLHRSEERFLAIVSRFAHEIAAPKPGDLIVFKYGRCYSHGAIVTQIDPIRVVHAFLSARMVIEEELSQNIQLKNAKPRFFSHWSD
jgi:NlpC/P60 family putative phage cell wall peptidase